MFNSSNGTYISAPTLTMTGGLYTSVSIFYDMRAPHSSLPPSSLLSRSREARRAPRSIQSTARERNVWRRWKRGGGAAELQAGEPRGGHGASSGGAWSPSSSPAWCGGDRRVEPELQPGMAATRAGSSRSGPERWRQPARGTRAPARCGGGNRGPTRRRRPARGGQAPVGRVVDPRALEVLDPRVLELWAYGGGLVAGDGVEEWGGAAEAGEESMVTLRPQIRAEMGGSPSAHLRAEQRPAARSGAVRMARRASATGGATAGREEERGRQSPTGGGPDASGCTREGKGKKKRSQL
ncbi:unnamed protein product [Urochloa humidicola]